MGRLIEQRGRATEQEDEHIRHVDNDNAEDCFTGRGCKRERADELLAESNKDGSRVRGETRGGSCSRRGEQAEAV